jgi:hypothetical protein
MFMPANDVNTAGEWHFSQAMPATGTCVAFDGTVGEPPAASGGAVGW